MKLIMAVIKPFKLDAVRIRTGETDREALRCTGSAIEGRPPTAGGQLSGGTGE